MKSARPNVAEETGRTIIVSCFGTSGKRAHCCCCAELATKVVVGWLDGVELVQAPPEKLGAQVRVKRSSSAAERYLRHLRQDPHPRY